jgi:predicted TIM-barrel fold metal-dependent hydrolase
MYYAPVRLAHMVGSIMNILLGSERIVFGTDWPAAPADLSVKAVLNLQIPKDMQEGWGYPPITTQDKANMLGLNLAKLLNVEVPKKYKSAAPVQASAH